jgi:hypothetical protein
VILEDCELKIKVIALAFVFLIGCIDSCEVNNVFGGVCYKGMIMIVIISKVKERPVPFVIISSPVLIV